MFAGHVVKDAVLCSIFRRLLQSNWMDFKSNKVSWPPKHVKFNKHKMHLLQPDDDWLTYECRKRLGPFDSLQIANQVEEHCINISTNEDTDEMCEKAIKANKTQNTRKRKKPAYLTDTPEEEQITGNTDKSIKANKTQNTRKKKNPAYFSDISKEEQVTENMNTFGTSSFVLPPSNFQLQNLDEHESCPVNIESTIVLNLPLDIIETSNMSECERLESTTEGCDENNRALENFSLQEHQHIQERNHQL
ncbi:hypothetical protein DMN91_006184 [Ooceraea biroi]|uniref:Uncharacterized protein n=1 Tax=Ooceraea biroi TaxID=2015173 RepID=A0A3L8DPQ9_OOCBI|nr:hypothetical protein DMN91_006184 [Ooceraea biroi]